MKVRLSDPRAAEGSSREIRTVVDGREVTFIAEKGKAIEVPDEVGASLLEQSDVWAPSGEEAKKVAEKIEKAADKNDGEA